MVVLRSLIRSNSKERRSFSNLILKKYLVFIQM